MKLINKIFAATFAASFSLPIYSQINKGFDEKNNIKSEGDTLLAENISDDSGTLKISVTGTRSPREVKNVPGAVTVIDQKDISERGTTELKDIFRYDAGIDLKSETETYFTDSGQGDVTIRGFDGNRVLMQRDNIRLPAVYKFGSAYQIFRSEMVDFNFLKSAEIVKGASSALYGSDALGGVVTFQTIFPEDILEEDENSSFEINNTYTSFNTGYSSVAKYAGRDDQSGLEGVLVITKTGAQEAKVKAEQKYINDKESDGFNVSTNIVKNFDDYTRGYLIIENIDKETKTIVKEANLPSSSYSTAIEDRTVKRTMVSANYEFDNPESDNFVDYFKVTAYLQNAYSTDDALMDVKKVEAVNIGDTIMGRNGPTKATSATPEVAAHKLQNDYDLTDNSYGANIQLRSDLFDSNTNHRITYGIDYSLTSNERVRSKIKFAGLTGTTTVKDSPDSDTTLLGIYLIDEISFDNSKWEFIPSLRFDYYDLDSTVDATYKQSSKSQDPVDINKQIINPSLSVLYKANKNLTFFGSYDKGFRAPQYSEVNTTYGNLTRRYYIVNNPDLKSETSDNYEIGVNGAYDKLTFGLTGFWTNFKNRIDGYTEITPDSQGYTRYQFQNKDKAEIYGVEFNSDYNFNSEPSGYSVFNSLAWTVGNDTSTSTYKPLGVDPFKALVGIRYDSQDNKWGYDLVATYTGIAEAEDKTKFIPDKSIVLDLISFININDRLKFDIGVYNLFDEKYFNYKTVRSESSTAADIDKLSEPGRNAKIGFKFIF